MSTASPKIKSRKRPWLAALLNLIPLIGLAGCAVDTTKGSVDVSFLIWALFIWGLGYLYLGHWGRFLLAMLAPWLLCPASYLLSPTWDPEHHSPTLTDLVPTILILGSACILTAIHAARLAAARNAALDAPPDAGPPQPEAPGAS